MLALRLPHDIESRLDELARRTGRSVSACAREAIVEKLNELEAPQRSGRTFSLDEIERLVRSRAPDAVLRREGDRLVVEKPVLSGLTDWLQSIEPWAEEFPDVDASMTALDEPDFAGLHDRPQQSLSVEIRVMRIVSKGHPHGAEVRKRWEAGTVDDGRPTLFREDIEDVADNVLFVVTQRTNQKRGSVERGRLDLILEGRTRTVGAYRSAVGKSLADADIAWDLNHDFYSLGAPE